MTLYYGGADPSGVQPMILPQDTSEAARQALAPQAPGSEFTPTPHPDIPRILARMKQLDAICTAICNELYMYGPGGQQPNWERREDLHEQEQAADRERAGLNTLLRDIYEGSGSDNDNDEPADINKIAPAVIVGEDKAPGV